MGIRLQVDFKWHQDPHNHIVKGNVEHQFKYLFLIQKITQCIKRGIGNRHWLCGFGSVTDDSAFLLNEASPAASYGVSKGSGL